MRVEQTILNNLLFNEEYTRKVLPFLKEEYFQFESEGKIFSKIESFINAHNKIPTKDILLIEFENDSAIPENTYEEIVSLVKDIRTDNNNISWLLNATEKFCQERAVFNAVSLSIRILDGEEKNLDKGMIPELLTQALSVSFDTNVGHDFLENYEERFAKYHEKEEHIPFDIDIFNIITHGGLPPKSLTVFLAGTGVGKTLAMCHFAAANLLLGKNVLYISMEMSEYKISERIDANLLNVPIEELKNLTEDAYKEKIEKLGFKTNGKLIVKEYPTASVGSGHFRHLLNELKLKKNFIPDIIYIDYLNICSSSRLKFGSNVNSYSYIKAIAEEIRGLAVERGVPIVSATQVNRSGYDSSDIDLTDTSESWGLPMTTDYMFALISSEELENMNQLQVKQLKNRYGDPTKYRRFSVGIDRSKMRLYNIDFETSTTEFQDESDVIINSKTKKDFNLLFDD